MGEFGYFIFVLLDKGWNVCFCIGFFVLGGFEIVNWGIFLFFDGVVVINGDCFIYGGGLMVVFDVWLIDWIILLMQVKERVFFGMDVGNFYIQIGLGVCFIIN